MIENLSNSQLNRLAKGIKESGLAAFYAKPENQKAFEAWKAEKKKKEEKQ